MHTFPIVPRVSLLLAGALVLTATSLSSAPVDHSASVNMTSTCGVMAFGTPTDHSVGSEPQTPGVGDLDSDGDDDIVIPNYGPATLTVLLATGAGFVAAPGSPVTLTGSPFVAVIGDFTGDNVPDAAVGVGHDVVVLQGNGNGTFSGQTTTDVSDGLTRDGGSLTGGMNFATADLNGDSKLDLVLLAPNAAKVSVWLGTGSGSFVAAQDWENGPLTPAAVAIGDLNGDSRPDFAVGSSYADGSPAGSFVAVFVQQTDGSFSGPTTYEVYKSVRGLAIGDLNGDTHPEIIAPNYYGHGYQAYGGDDLGRVSILFGNGDGTFGNAIYPLTGADNPDSVAVADFDGDGDLDIATSNAYQRGSPGRISILRGDGAGGFAAPDLFANSVGTHPAGLIVGDFGTNSVPDVVWIGDYQNPSSTMKLMMNQTIVCDTTPPVITPTVEGTVGGGGWYVSDVDVEWDVIDNESSISGSTGCGFTIVTADTAGITFTCVATSEGGTSSQSVTIKRDATAPTAAATSSPPPNANGWRKTNVTVVFTGTDALSGGVTCTPQAVVSTEGSNQSRTGYCYDAAGNQSAAAVASDINIDKTGPTVTINIPPDGSVFNRNQVVTVNYSCGDVLSGVASCSGPIASGQTLDTSKKTNNAKFTVTGTDRAGNTTKATVNYTVR